MTFDTTKFVQVTYGFVIPPRSRALGKNLHTVKEYINSAIFMATQIERVEHSLTTARPEYVRPAYFRASLNELCRIEDIMKAHNLPSFYHSDDPTLHIVKLLRNYQTHIASTKLSAGQILVKLSGEEMVYRSFIVENISTLELRKLNSSKDYSDKQLEHLVKLFDSEQRKFGVVQLLYHIAMHVDTYAKSSLAKHRSQ